MNTQNNTTWNLKELYNSKSDWLNHYDEVINEILEILHKLNDIEINKLINKYIILLNNRDKLFGYLKLNKDKNINNNFNDELIKVKDLDNYISRLKAIINDKIIENRKNVCKENIRYVKKLRENEKTINYAKYNKLIENMNDAKNEFENLINNLKFKKIFDSNKKSYKITLNSFNTYLRSQDGELRKNAFEIVEEECKKNKEKFSKYLCQYIKSNIELKEVMGYKSCLEYSLQKEEINKKNYEIAVKYINNNRDIFLNILKIKNKENGSKKLHLYDLYDIVHYKNHNIISYEKTKEIIINALSILGEEYSLIVKKAFNENWIDIYEKSYKCPSAYSYNIYGSHPYILLNFQGRLNDIFITAHEIGHAVHYYLSNINQNYLNAQTTSLSTEIAAMTNECLVYNYLLEQNIFDKNKILMAYLNKFQVILCKQSILNEFENSLYLKIKDKSFLTSDDISNVYINILKKYYENQIIIGTEVYEWTRNPHLYKEFHNYIYIIAFCIAVKISNNIMDVNEKYIDALKLGQTKDIKEILKSLNISLEDSNIYKETFDELKKIINIFNSAKD